MIYLKIMDDSVHAFADLNALKVTTGSEKADMILSEDEWDKARCNAYLLNGAIVLGWPDSVKAENIRAERNHLLREYDPVTIELQRMKRCAETAEETEKIDGLLAEWDAYAIQLCGLPEQDGFPWDGGGPLTPWPQKPQTTRRGN